ncbi:hypothetical protein D3C71_2073010 [compost metagenome]
MSISGVREVAEDMRNCQEGWGQAPAHPNGRAGQKPSIVVGAGIFEGVGRVDLSAPVDQLNPIQPYTTS